MSKTDKSREEIETLIKVANEVGEKAREENFSLGLPVYYMENGQLVELYSSGKKNIINIETNGRSKGE